MRLAVLCLLLLTSTGAQAKLTAPILSARLVMTGKSPSWALSFEIRNADATPRTISVYEPFMDFELEVTDASGKPLTVIQPPIGMAMQERKLTIPAHGRVSLSTPVHLAFARRADPDTLVYVIQSRPQAIRINGSVNVAGTRLPFPELRK